jgi:hypothetical protein
MGMPPLGAAAILDTSALNEINRAITFSIKNDAAGGSPEGRAQDFLDGLRRILGGFTGRCGCQVFTSSIVFSEQIDPRLPGSNLHHQDELLDEYASAPGFLQEWSQICEQLIPTEDVSEDEAADLRVCIRTDLGKHDHSLIVAGLKVGQAQGGPVVLVTDDLDLIQCVEHLCRTTRAVILQGSRYETGSLSCYLSLQALREIHRQCGITNEFWRYVTLSFTLHNTGRTGPAAERHLKDAAKVLGEYHRDCEEKDRLDVTRDLAQELGAE